VGTDQAIRLNIGADGKYKNASFVDNFRTVPPKKFMLGVLIRDPSLHEHTAGCTEKVSRIDAITDFRGMAVGS
jgi:hypothetical protein